MLINQWSRVVLNDSPRHGIDTSLRIAGSQSSQYYDMRSYHVPVCGIGHGSMGWLIHYSLGVFPVELLRSSDRGLDTAEDAWREGGGPLE